MTDGLDQALVDAGLALMRADPQLTVIADRVPAGQQPPYVRVYTTVEWPPDDPNNNLAGRTGRAVVRWICHCVGGNDTAATAVAQRVRATLLDQRPTVAALAAGQVGMIRHEQDAPPTIDETTGAAYVDAMHVYRMTAQI